MFLWYKLKFIDFIRLLVCRVLINVANTSIQLSNVAVNVLNVVTGVVMPEILKTGSAKSDIIESPAPNVGIFTQI